MRKGINRLIIATAGPLIRSPVVARSSMTTGEGRSLSLPPVVSEMTATSQVEIESSRLIFSRPTLIMWTVAAVSVTCLSMLI